jgi:ABC-type transport system substrate-binding protein
LFRWTYYIIHIHRFTVDKKSRGDIARELTKIVQADNPNAKPIPYQTVFAVTKKLQGGPPKDTPAATSGTPSGVSSETPASA